MPYEKRKVRKEWDMKARAEEAAYIRRGVLGYEFVILPSARIKLR